MKKITYSIKIEPLLKEMEECGDICLVEEKGEKTYVAMIDALGHGREARKSAVKAFTYLKNNLNNDLIGLIQQLHKYLRGDRGIVILIGIIDMKNERFTYTGIGNIVGRIIGINKKRMILRDGVVGYGTIHPVLNSCFWSPKDLLLIYTDGIREHFNDWEFIDILRQDPDRIVEELVERLGKGNDDAACLAIKYSESF